MRLLDFIEEHHRVRTAPHGLGELAGLVEADVAGRRANHARDGVFLLVLAHVDAHHRVLVVEQERGERARQLRLADAGRAEEQEAAERPLRILQAGAGPSNRVGHRLDGFVLAHHPFVQPRLHANQLLDFAFHQPAHRDAGPLGHHLGDVLFVDLLLEHAAGARRRTRFLRLDLALEFRDAAVLQLRRPRVVALALRRFHVAPEAVEFFLQARRLRDRRLLLGPVGRQAALFLLQVGELLLELRQAVLRGLVGFLAQGLALDLELHDAALHFVELGRHRVDLHAQPRGGLVDEVDGLVGQEAVGDVAVGKHGR